MTTPALQRLRERFPKAHLTLFTPEKLVDLWLRHPSIDDTVTFALGESPWVVARRLGEGKFDTALVLPNSSRSALEVWLAKVPVRVGYAGSWRRWLLTRSVPARPDRVRMRKRSPGEIQRLVRKGAPPPAVPESAHQIHDYLHLAGALGADVSAVPPNLAVTQAEKHDALKSLAAEFPAGGIREGGGRSPLLLGLNPGAEYGPAKRWPAANFAAAAREVSRRVGNCVWLLFGGEKDVKLGNEVLRLAGVNAVNLAGKTSLRQLVALLSQCRLLLTNDTGPMHVAAALGTPVIVPFGSTSPALTQVVNATSASNSSTTAWMGSWARANTNGSTVTVPFNGVRLDCVAARASSASSALRFGSDVSRSVCVKMACICTLSA